MDDETLAGLLADLESDRVERKASASEIRDQAIARGMTTLAQDGWERVLQGVTTADEVLRVGLSAGSHKILRGAVLPQEPGRLQVGNGVRRPAV